MLRRRLYILLFVVLLTLTGCSEATQQEAGEAMDHAGEALENAAEDAANVTQGAIEGASEAVEDNRQEPDGE